MGRIILASLVMCFALHRAGHAANIVLVESKAVAVSSNGVTVGVYITNDQDLSALVLPLVLRSVTSGAFIADTLFLEPLNRGAIWLNGYRVVSYLPSEDNISAWYCNSQGFKTRGQPDFATPDAVFYAGVVTDGDSCLPAGNDGAPPGGTPSFRLTFGVGATIGTFEIDTTCITPGNHLIFQDCGVPAGDIIPTFTKGVIEIGCDCDSHTDPDCDNDHDIVDYLKVRNVANGTIPHIPDPNPRCPVETTDVNCDGVTNTTDKNYMFAVVFDGADPNTLFCDPCP